MQIHAMLGAALAASTLLTLSPQLDAQSAAVGPVQRAPASVLQHLRVRQATLQRLALPATTVQGFELDVQLGGRSHRLVLREHDVRALGFRLLVADDRGIRVAKTPANITYRGVVAGAAESDVAASLIDGQLTAYLTLGRTAPTWCIEPLTRVHPNADRTIHVVHRAADSVAPSRRCGVTGTAPHVPDTGSPRPTGRGPIYECEIACDADFDEYRRNGSDVVATQHFVATTMNSVNVIYRRDVEIEFRITTILVRTTQLYTSNNHSTLLSQYRSQWRNRHGGIARDISHLFTGKFPASGVIGVAALRGICSTRNGYGLSYMRGTFGLADLIGLVAHELGHSFGSGHCSGTDCNIMCPTLGGCAGNLSRFGASASSQIIAFRNSRTCLRRKSGNEPVLTTVSPPIVEVFRGGTVTLQGARFTNALRVRVADTVLTPGNTPRTSFRIVDDATITFEAPTGVALAPHLVSVESAAGFSQMQALDYRVTRPRKLDAPTDARRGRDFLWEFGAGPRHDWILTVSASPTTFRLLGETWLQSPTLLLRGTNNAVGYGSAQVRVPNSATLGLRFHSQVVTLNPFKNKLAGNTNVTSSTIR